MKAMLFSFLLALFALPLANAEVGPVPTDEEPETTIITVIDQYTWIVQDFDDGYDCNIWLDEKGNVIDAIGPDC